MLLWGRSKLNWAEYNARVGWASRGGSMGQYGRGGRMGGGGGGGGGGLIYLSFPPAWLDPREKGEDDTQTPVKADLPKRCSKIFPLPKLFFVIIFFFSTHKKLQQKKHLKKEGGTCV